MANLKEVRIRIASTLSTQQITKAMKLVSATKLRKAQGAIMQMRPYADKLNGILKNLADSVDDDRLGKYFKEHHEVKKVLLVVITSDRGLCGGFNANVIKKTRQVIAEKYKQQADKGNVDLLFIGKKGYDVFRKLNYNCNTSYMDTFQHLDAEHAFNIGDFCLEQFLSGEYQAVEVVYNQFKNAATQILSNETLLPVELEVSKADRKNTNKDYIFEPDKVQILEELIPRTIKTQLYRAMLDSFASEHGARMISMDKATDNAGELIKKYKLQYNQARQAAITNEISEIVGGAAALQG